jgi:hypothetical protein
VNNEHVDWLENPFLVAVGDEVSIRVAESEEVDEPMRRERGDDPEIARKRRYFLYQAYRREFEVGGGAERPAELSPEDARGIRRRLYEEYKAEFEGEPSAS